ncbi:Cytochrome c family protein [Citrifermentans bremense]|uniref:Cytochrome c family protein n=1 Tax=Citrifermentans bremense TaxID=60035 RepID=A0A6S6M7X8_9BACT|nr:cytochrome c3 family protein [Citrifermentans bremense]BCG47525.1 Cytochrome c family protein [Citrifermentans bremense]
MKKKVCSALAKSSWLSLLLLGVVLAASTAFAAKVATVDIPVKAELYATMPAPLSPVQCAQCHNTVFGALKDAGGRHRFDCQQCHKTIHAYNPKKGNYDEIMPKCASCHTEIHGPANKDCSTCHNPHSPGKVAMTPRLVNTCATCHPAQKEELVKFPSKHSKVSCDRCHTSHGYIPTCFNCHKPHYKEQPIETCLKCHPVHQPKSIHYPSPEPAQTCGACHGKIYEKWKKTPSKHAKVNCATCHRDKHGYVPQCTECHKAPHPKSILDRFPKCLGCHLDVHDLPSMK